MQRPPVGESSPWDWPDALKPPFALLAFDWDGTAVENRRADAAPVRDRLSRLLARGVWVMVVSGTNVQNIHGQLSAGIDPLLRDRLRLSTNRGSEVWDFAGSDPRLLYRRQETPLETVKLNAIAQAVCEAVLERSGLHVGLVMDRLNRRKIDLLPEPQWADPPKSEIGALAQATDTRLRNAGFAGGIADVLRITAEMMWRYGLEEARVTTDAKNIEVGLTDKADAMRWLEQEILGPYGVLPESVFIGGDEFGPIGGIEGSDARMLLPSLAGAVWASFGPEPFGLPSAVFHLPGGPSRFQSFLDLQLGVQ
ncbi:MAG: hypothetical protein ACKVVP_05545 [Chloroflexota bacterium]